MNAPQPAQRLAPALPDWLEAGLVRAGSEAVIVAQQTYRLRAVAIDQPLLMVPLSGIKRVRRDGRQLDVPAGRFLVVHGAQSREVENLIEADGTAYRGWAVSLPWRVVALARTMVSEHRLSESVSLALPATHDVDAGELAPLLPALRQLLDTLAPPVDAISMDHALLGVALALVRAGQSRFLQADAPSLAARIRLMVAEAPDRSWTSADFEQLLHLSGATLRRRLVDEHTSLRAVLREARLHHGLVLLQTSRRPLKSIALACGYRSVASFSRNFSEYFGLSPVRVAHR